MMASSAFRFFVRLCNLSHGGIGIYAGYCYAGYCYAGVYYGYMPGTVMPRYIRDICRVLLCRGILSGYIPGTVTPGTVMLGYITDICQVLLCRVLLYRGILRIYAG